ncbi:MAG: hypothetical protein J6Q01_03790 [Alistipes sp.]|nr:hypothetical protein [Alistipes sp.]
MKKLFGAFFVCVAMSFAGCIDTEFDLSDVSGEVTVGGEELVVPLADINTISLADLIGDNETLKTNEEGVYQITFSSFGDDPTKYESIQIEGISIPNITGLSPKLDPISFSFQELPSKLTMRGINEKFEVDFPTINRFVKVEPISIDKEIGINLPSSIAGQGNLPEFIASQLPPISATASEEIVFEAEISLLEQLKRIGYVEFGSDKYPFGAPFEIVIDLNGLKGINGGGSAKFNIEFPAGYYLRDENGNDLPSATHNKLTKDIAISKNQKSATILFYLHKIDYSDHSFVDNKLQIEDHIHYGYDINVALCAGNYNLDAKPKFTLKAAPDYKDVEVIINHIEVPGAEYDINYSFDGIPTGISVEKIAFVNSPLTLSLKGLEWLEVLCCDTNEIFSPDIEIELPKCMKFGPHNSLDNTTNKLLATAKELAAGVQLSLSHIDCKSDEITIGNGSIGINGKLKANIHLENLDNHSILVSSIVPPTSPLNVTVAINDLTLEIDKANSVVKWSEDQLFDLNLGDQVPAISQTIEVPEMISEVKCIEIGKANSNGEPLAMLFRVDAGSSFPVKELDIDLSVNLGKMLRPTKATLDSGIIRKSESGDYILSIDESWQPGVKALEKLIEFEALENIPAIQNGQLTINQSFPVTGGVKIKSGESIDLSKVSDAKVNIDVQIDDIEVRTFIGKVDISVKPENISVDLSELGDLAIDVNSLSLNPVLNVKLKDNPTGVGFMANIAVKTYNAEGKELATISVPTIPVAGNGPSNIILSTPRNADKYSDEGVTFIAIDELSKLLSNGIPSKIGVDMSVASNKDEEITLDLKEAAKGYNIEYQYEVLMPLEFDGNTDISLETSVSDLNETFVELADTTNGLKVGDVGLIAEINTTIPFNIVISAELINAEGTTEGIAARLNINDCVIKGYNKATDGEYRTSKIDLDFDLGESGSLAGLKSADGVKLKFSIYNTDAEVATLTKDQFINGKLKLRVREGLTVDIFDFLNAEGE